MTLHKPYKCTLHKMRLHTTTQFPLLRNGSSHSGISFWSSVDSLGITPALGQLFCIPATSSVPTCLPWAWIPATSSVPTCLPWAWTGRKHLLHVLIVCLQIGTEIVSPGHLWCFPTLPGFLTSGLLVHCRVPCVPFQPIKMDDYPSSSVLDLLHPVCHI